MKVRGNIKYMVAFLSLVSAVAYAGISIAAEKYSPFASASEAKPSAKASTGKTSSSKARAPLISFDDAVAADEHGPLHGSEGQIDELKKMQPIVEDLEKAVEAHNVLADLKGYRDTELRYREMQQLHQKSIEVLKQSEQCVINYIGRYFNNPVKVWSGIDLRQNPQNHDLRKGLSAWALSGYETAKAAQLSPITNEDVSAINSETIAIGDAGVDKTAGMTDSEVISYADNQNNNNLDVDGNKDQMREFSNAHDGVFFKDPSKQNQYEEDSRRSDLLPTDIGSEASLLLAKEPAKWGNVKQNFAVWNDQRTFYDQYLNGKYGNIEEYIANLEISQEMRDRIYAALSADQQTFMVQAEKEIMNAAEKSKMIVEKWYADEYAKQDKKYNEDLIAVTQKANADVADLEAKRDSEVKTIQSEIDSHQSNRSNYATQIYEINSSNEALNRQILDAQNELKNAEALTEGAVLTPEQQLEQNALKIQLENSIIAFQGIIAQQNLKKVGIQEAYDKESQAIDAKEKDKANVKTSYASMISAVYKVSDDEKVKLKETFEEDVKNLKAERESKINKISLAAEAAKLTMGINSTITVSEINNTTTLIVGLAKKDAAENVKNTRKALSLIGDDLYRGNQHARVMGYHNAMIESLKGKDASFETLNLPAVAAKVPGITTELRSIVSGVKLEEDLKTIDKDFAKEAIKNSKNILTVTLFDNALKEINSDADDDYFVGETPKNRDFMSPKAMPDYNLPPLREYVHFDYIDLKNAAKNATKMTVGLDEKYEETILGQIIKKSRFVQTEPTPLSVIDKKTFLSYGGKIPEIWNLMLKDKAFVERDFFLSPAMASDDKNVTVNALKLGGEAAALFRGGVYPCLIKDIKSNNKVCKSDGTIADGQGVVDVSVRSKGILNKDEYFLGLGFVTGERRQSLLGQNLPICQGLSANCKSSIEIKNGRPTQVSVPVLATSKGVSDGSSKVLGSGSYSELGTILALNGGKIGSSRVHNLLTLTPEMESLLIYGERMEAAAKNDKVPEFNADEKINDNIYNTAQFSNNQIGDFLLQTEQEQTYKNAVDELKDSIAEMHTDLLKILKNIGFAPSEDFDIAKDSDYQLTVSKLKSIKQSKMNAANKMISSIQEGDSELLRESKRSYGRLHDALALDKDAVTTMSMTSYDSTALDEEVKTGKANLAVEGKYQETADKSFEEQLNSFLPAYCVAY